MRDCKLSFIGAQVAIATWSTQFPLNSDEHWTTQGTYMRRYLSDIPRKPPTLEKGVTTFGNEVAQLEAG